MHAQRPARRRAVACALIGVLGLAVSACSNSAPPTTADGGSSGKATTLKVASLPIGDLGAYFYALDNHLFDQHGIRVTDVTSTGGAAAISAMVAGSVDIAYSGNDSVLKASAKKLPVAIVCAANDNQPSGPQDSAGIVAPAGITSTSQLAGKTLGTNALGNINQIYTQLWLQQHGVDPKGVKFVEIPFPEQLAALQKGQISGTLMPQPFLAQALSSGSKLLGWPYRTGPDKTTAIASFAASTAAISKDKKSYQAFVTTMTEADREANDPANRNAVIAALLKHTKLTKAAVAHTSFVRWTTKVTKQQLSALGILLVKFGELPAAPNLDNIFASL